MSERSRWWQFPRAFLYAWDFARSQAQFLELERAALERSSFLDHRIDADLSAIRTVPAGEVVESPIDASPMPRGFLFHTAFCASTLLARSLDRPGRLLALREPATLLQLADLFRGLTRTAFPFDILLRRTLTLLARPFSGDESVLLKPTNVANNLIGPLLQASPDARGLVLYDDLEPFLLSVLKRPREADNGIRAFLRRLRCDFRGRPPGREPSDLGEASALAWHYQIELVRGWLEGPLAGRLRILPAGRLLAHPAAALHAAADWLGLDMDREACRIVAAGPLWQTHAKRPDLAYDRAQRRREQDLARRVGAAALASGLTYVRAIGGEPLARFHSAAFLAIPGAEA